MPILLVLSSLGVLFYIRVLVALYRDGMRRNFDHPSVRKVSLGVVARIDSEQAAGRAALATPRYNSVNVLLQPMGDPDRQNSDRLFGAKSSRPLSARVPSGPYSA
jgi:hypothetical protein